MNFYTHNINKKPLGKDTIISIWWFGTFVPKDDLATLNIWINRNVTQNHIEVNKDCFGNFPCIGHLEMPL
jgi:hypothetical protein